MSVLLALAALLAQEGSPLQERARVEYVLVDAVALDRQGHLVADLTLDDFIVREDGARVQLESLDVLDLRGSATGPDEPVPPPDEARPSITKSQVIMAVDFEFTSYSQARKTFERLEEHLEGAEKRRNLEFLVYSLEGGALMEGFSEDPAAALRALGDYQRSYLGRRREESARGLFPEDRSGRDGGVDDLSDLEKRFQACRYPADLLPAGHTDFTSLWNCVMGELHAFVEQQNDRTLTVLQELEALAEAFQYPESVKSILFVSPGFSLHPGTAAVQLATRYLSQNRMTTTKVAQLPGELPTGETVALDSFPDLRSFEPQFAGVIDACARNRVVFHTFDIYNLWLAADRTTDVEQRIAASPPTGTYRSFRRELNEGMSELARATGGTFHTGSTLDAMGPVMESTRFVYILGYRAPPGGKEGEFRKIKVKCKRKGVTLRHRRGYFR